jgi:hypothetical protein
MCHPSCGEVWFHIRKGQTTQEGTQMPQIDRLELCFHERKEPTPGAGWSIVPETIYKATVNDRTFVITIVCDPDPTRCAAWLEEEQSDDPATGHWTRVTRAGSTYDTLEESLADMVTALVRGVVTGVWWPQADYPLDYRGEQS